MKNAIKYILVSLVSICIGALSVLLFLYLPTNNRSKQLEATIQEFRDRDRRIIDVFRQAGITIQESGDITRSIQEAVNGIIANNRELQEANNGFRNKLEKFSNDIRKILSGFDTENADITESIQQLRATLQRAKGIIQQLYNP